MVCEMCPGEMKTNISSLYTVYISVSQEARAFYSSTEESREVLFPCDDVPGFLGVHVERG